MGAKIGTSELMQVLYTGSGEESRHAFEKRNKNKVYKKVAMYGRGFHSMRLGSRGTS
jgi:hypothetical protein